MEQYIGQIKFFCGNFAPKDWAFCNGQSLPIAQNTALFALLGATYGGDGKTNFAVPDLRGAAVLHPTVAIPLGTKGGNATKQLAADNFPAHNHKASATIKAKSTTDTQSNPVGNYPANSGNRDAEYHKIATNNIMAADSIVATVSTEGVATPDPISNMQPYLAVNFIICTGNGEFPPRP
jgi:microcystin-dependent protein